MLCSLCNTRHVTLFHKDNRRTYYRCLECRLIFVPSVQYLTSSQEKHEYDFHENNVFDEGYRNFLSRTFNPLLQRLQPNHNGLDFGCGPNSALQVMFKEVGHAVAVYDIFYHNHPAVFNAQYQFITATEVIEHLHRPMFELNRLWRCLEHGGCLAIMTKLATDEKAFSTWHYKNDLTHVCFYSKATFNWLADKLQASVEFIDKDVVFLTKNQ